MAENRSTLARNVGIGLLVLLIVPLSLVGIVGVRTLNPLKHARSTLSELETDLGEAARYTPSATGAIEPARMETFLNVRESVVAACEEYAPVQRAFESIGSLDSLPDPSPKEVKDTVFSLGGAAFEITPFLARYFELRNRSLLAAGMGLEEYVYIYALVYHDQLLSGPVRKQIFSDGDALSEEASRMLQDCLARQITRIAEGDPARDRVNSELSRMQTDPHRLVWQDGLPATIQRSIDLYRPRLDPMFCAGAAGLEMERDAKRAIGLALE